MGISTNNVSAYSYNDYIDPHKISDGIDLTNKAKVRLRAVDEIYYLSTTGGETATFVEVDVEMSSHSYTFSSSIKSGIFCQNTKTVSFTKTFYPDDMYYYLYSRAYPLTTQAVNDYEVLSNTAYSADVTDMKITGKIDASGKKGSIGFGASVSGSGSISDLTFTHQNKLTTTYGSNWKGIVKSIYDVKTLGTSYFAVTDLVKLDTNKMIRDMNYINSFDYLMQIYLNFEAKPFWYWSSGCANYIYNINKPYSYTVITGDASATSSPDSEIWKTPVDSTPIWCPYGTTYNANTNRCE